MKTLYLLRHAKSSWKNPLLDDYDRPLNKRGREDIQFMARHISSLINGPIHLLSSPAKRARKTVLPVASALGISNDDIDYQLGIYEASAGALVEHLQALHDSTTQVLMVGHNPGFSQLHALLCQCAGLHYPTCGLMRIELAIQSWRDCSAGCGRSTMFDVPRALWRPPIKTAQLAAG